MTHTFYTIYLKAIYGDKSASHIESRLQKLIEQYRGRIPNPADSSLSERDSLLITYGDQVQDAGKSHLQTLNEFCESRLRGVVSGIHILPFYPWSSDDGFSVKDYRAVDTALGTWNDVEKISQSFRLMFDGVINHYSAQGEWFQKFLHNEKPYRDYFFTVDGDPDLSKVVRPRALPLLTEYETASGKRRVWTTFSADQVDLDFRNPDVLLEIFDVLLMYAERGAQFIRLDAIAYLWKEIGTSCIHLPQTHAVIQLLRAVLDDVAPHVRLITETNVPHADNISYFGDGKNEAQLVYNFALPPLVLHTFRTGDAGILSRWASDLELPSEQTTFFNFLASHDGVGLNPARGILSAAEIDALVNKTLAHGGLISYKQNTDGTQSPYEMNINYFDALSNPFGDEPIEIQVNRFIAAQAIMLSLIGLPGIYFHSLFGSRNWAEGVRITNHNRTINRQKLERVELEEELISPVSLRYQVFTRFRQMLLVRSSSVAFHPHGSQKVLDVGNNIFAISRVSPDGTKNVLCLQNITQQEQHIENLINKTARDLLTNRSQSSEIILQPYQTMWLEII
ncbi:sugar phosphorylase [Candidatus Villigracilis saccharophilus]|uniref:sugar phosphorylase n=1 Tax=Candidatus Villigracilis saccharophilus TaxID=3140684 RepID=UPI0031EB19B3